MDNERPLFILAGNGPYENRGCEAIIRGTTKILRENFQDPRFICLSHFSSEEQFRQQCLQEIDDSVVHLASCMISKGDVIQNILKPETWSQIFQYFFDRDSFLYADMLPHLDEAVAVLSVGGDNYTLDYGMPTLFTALDNIVLAHQRPLAIWGASIGPFSSMPDFEQYMSDHLRKVTAIFARESTTVEYLNGIGVNGRNVCLVADPAFLLEPVQPKEELSIDKGAIGLNISPLMAKFVTGGDLERWTKMAGAIMREVAGSTERQVYLIPHVITPGSNDYTFMQKALSSTGTGPENITLVPPRFNAAETKWIISRMALFAGARTHATIAALSSCVPTLCFAYSIKAQGINRDIFGHTDYCIDAKDLVAERVASRITSMLDNETAIRTDLSRKIPDVQQLAQNAGRALKRIID